MNYRHKVSGEVYAGIMMVGGVATVFGFTWLDAVYGLHTVKSFVDFVGGFFGGFFTIIGTFLYYSCPIIMIIAGLVTTITGAIRMFQSEI